MSERRLVLVVGVGRSGTSLLAGILGQLGLHIPQPEVEADDTNPRGFGEPRWVVDFHTRLMRARRVTVLDGRPAAWERTREAERDPAVAAELRDWLAGEFAQAEEVVVKDPRVAWFLELWQASARELGVPTGLVTMLRHPAEVLLSARRSYGTWQTDASRATAWLNVMLETERVTRGATRVFVRYQDLLADWGREVARVGTALDLPLLAEFDRARFPQVDAFVDPGLHRNRGRWEDLAVPARMRDLTEEVWERLRRLAEPDGAADPEVAAGLDDAHARFAELYAEAEAIAQSSVTAVKPRKAPAQRPPAAPAAPARPAVPPSLRVRLARRVPAPARRALRRALGRAR